MRGTCVAQVAGWQLPSHFSNARPPLSSARPPLPNARPPLFPMLALHFFQRTRANICLNCYFVDFIHYFEEIMFNFGIFTNPGGRYRFCKFHNSKNLETQAFTLGFGLHFTDFDTLFWKKIYVSWFSENPGRHYRFGKFHRSENLETQAFTIGFASI